ncbi:MAG TPA: Gfo/Idh/MocA family oxidoreductase [Candidatus Paceibacterota bacterium]|nr:Gfo/Idh/MocA family oxidoreductase [Verrucomicrobiota bacterium]HOX04047.1 Gfo/Idh/MocA family oxidoreductase [Verrucomicrobiota bacterium]HRZ46970.1 Gfo/Idh/MocA family oxidoreductase [Candidatus Paceibacterota bacterium]HRZ94391.1 Gfo/Idh/MocA family oxidoreductase [Candidatus Paceibacterota bacterium]
MNPKQTLNRRQFLGTSAATAVAAIVPRRVLGGPGFVPPSRKINLAYVGCGTQGLRQLMPALEKTEIQVVAVCDPNRKSDDYPEWGRNELNDKIRRFLNDPGWARGARGGCCGREVGLELVQRHSARQRRSGTPAPCRAYADVRELLEKERDLDAVYIMTPDHLHGPIAVRAMRQGKHVVTHKPIANVLDEVRLARDAARTAGVVSQLFCSADQRNTPTIREWIASGAIGPVREVHNWSSRPFWPQGMAKAPSGSPPVPDGFDWDLWLGPAAARPYHPAYTHAVFRGWYDFGTGALGDMGHYSFRQIFEILNLGSPASVEARRSEYYEIEEFTWKKQVNRLSFPRASLIRWEFPARGGKPPVTLHWYDGGLRPPLFDELDADGQPMPDEGLLFIGDRGKLLAGFSGNNPTLIPKARMQQFAPPPSTSPPPADELDQFIRACQGGPAPDASFPRAYPFAETILLGTIAVRVNGKLRWDAEHAEFVQSPEANKLKSRKNRPGWEI